MKYQDQYTKMASKLQSVRYLRMNRSGFTLTEVIVASALLITAMVPILKALTSVHFSAVVIDRKTQAVGLAQAKLNEIKALSVYDYSDTFTSSNESLGDSYLAKVQDSAVNSNLRRITLTVGYDENGNNILATDETIVSLSTLIAKRW